MFWMNLLAFSLSLFRPMPIGTVVQVDPGTYPVPAEWAAFPPPAHDGSLFAPMPVGAPAPSAVKLYSVEVHFTDGPMKCVPPGHVKLLAASNMSSAQQPLEWIEGRSKARSIFVALKETGADHVELDLGLFGDGDYRVRQAVHLDTVTSLVLSGDGPEPCCAEVTVREVTNEPMGPPAVATCPHFGGPPMTCPAPMPYATPGCYGPVPAMCLLPEPIPVTLPSVADTPIMPCAMVTPPRPHKVALLCVVREGEKSRVRLASVDSSVTSARLTLEGGEAGKLAVTAGKKRVHVTGKRWKAEAERIELRDDGIVVLRGHVKLISDKIGVCASIKADELRVKVTRGEFDRVLGKGEVKVTEAMFERVPGGIQ